MQWSSEYGDALGGRDHSRLEIPSKARIQNRARLEIDLEAVIERVWRCIWRPRLSEIRWVVGGGRWMVRRVLGLY